MSLEVFVPMSVDIVHNHFGLNNWLFPENIAYLFYEDRTN